jgi:hypothetical protein
VLDPAFQSERLFECPVIRGEAGSLLAALRSDLGSLHRKARIATLQISVKQCELALRVYTFEIRDSRLMVLSIAANDPRQVTWCRTVTMCINSGGRQ